MISGVQIANFKCFSNLSLPLAPLTLLTGFNAAGKSTILQTILLLCQSLRAGGRASSLSINGPLVRLGTPGEVLNDGSSNELRISIDSANARITWKLQGEDRVTGSALRILQVEIETAEGRSETRAEEGLERLLPGGSPGPAQRIVETLAETVFLSALRVGTADVFPSPDDSLTVHGDVGTQGEFAPWWFDRLIDEYVDEKRRHASESAPTLRRQFNAWAGDLFPGAEGNVQRIGRTSLLRMELRLGQREDWRRPANIGYGLTYAFPVLVAGLIAKPGQTIIVDSPEAHLHPLGQSRMGRFLAQVAASGVQVIIETHSDHILNGVRLAARDALVSPSDVALHFFSRAAHAELEGAAQVTSPTLDRHGNVSEWPPGFFDQSEKDLASLAGWGQ